MGRLQKTGTTSGERLVLNDDAKDVVVRVNNEL